MIGLAIALVCLAFLALGYQPRTQRGVSAQVLIIVALAATGGNLLGMALTR